MDKLIKSKKGFGITEVLISAVVLGLLYMAILHMQTGNREALLRIRGRDGAIEVAQQVIDSLNRIGIASIPDESTPPGDDSEDEVVGHDYIWKWDPIQRSWDRGEKVGGGQSTIQYTPTITVSPTTDYTATNESNLETVSHVYAKQVNVQVSWQFKGSTQSINMSTVIR
ncbi:type IV pilus modification PilV family protein [Fibrobacter sp.]|uniref:type IV pilus modification PilV family protein n=1 Tax=Fibrobacter sp. TaxID=35828 RepID=UPI0025BA57EA|nr:type II secretion system protein [Fibrobacter sp.]MBQ9226495.1 type II secretion system protein [Fibrobacter sp.]MBR4006152.1 type II secretion system protein [Fibrobacter sp.]